MITMHNRIEIAREFAHAIDSEDIIKIILFGSVARGDDTEDSDIDILIISDYRNEIWEDKRRTIKSTKMYEAKDAYELSSGTRVENAYADYANNMKKLGNKARLAAMNTPKMKYDPEAAIKYKEEVEDLKAANNLAKMNSPKERQAQILGNKIFNAKKYMNTIRKEIILIGRMTRIGLRR